MGEKSAPLLRFFFERAVRVINVLIAKAEPWNFIRGRRSARVSTATVHLVNLSQAPFAGGVLILHAQQLRKNNDKPTDAAAGTGSESPR